MATYFRRAVKYFIQLIVLFIILFTFMFLTGTAAQNDGQSITQTLISSRGLLLAVAVVVLSLLYPRFGFVRRQIKGNVEKDRDAIVKAFVVSGYELDESEEAGQMVFRADNMAKRILTVWEDRVTVSQNDENIVVDGIRKEVVKIEFRLKSFLQSDENQ